MARVCREFSIYLSNTECSNFLRVLALSGGSIVASYVNSDLSMMNSWEDTQMCFKLIFLTERQVSKFHSFGFNTKPLTVEEDI